MDGWQEPRQIWWKKEKGRCMGYNEASFFYFGINGIKLALYFRRIERLLVFQPKSTNHSGRSARPSAIPPLTSGLLLLSVTRLRTYAETFLSAHSSIREGFLEDVQDLEDPGLDRTEKLRIVDRMWKSWGEVLGWGKASV
jgi:nuclear-control-of-ATPase protein 2